MKKVWKPGTMLYPLPAVIVSCGSDIDHSNLVTVAWTGIVCSDPAMTYISLRPERHSYAMVQENMEFTINLTTAAMARQTDWIGVRSGREFNKWQQTGLTPHPGVAVSCPYVQESPLSLECRVKTAMPLGSHTMFLAEIVDVLADERFFDPQTNAFHLDDADLMAYIHGHYYNIGSPIGRFGFSVKKK